MHISHALFLASAAALAVAQSTTTLSAAAATHTIQVGIEESFSPATQYAAIGDSVVFQFVTTTTHTVLQADYARPCEAKDADAFYSGALSSSSSGNDTFTLLITSTDPLWYFCSIGHHCSDGMVGVINPPAGVSVGQTLVSWIEHSWRSGRTNATAVQTPQGGVVVATGVAGTGDAAALGGGKVWVAVAGLVAVLLV